MALVEDNCRCQCNFCTVHQHCCIMDNGCEMHHSDENHDELWRDDILASLDPLEVDENHNPQPFDPSDN